MISDQTIKELTYSVSNYSFSVLNLGSAITSILIPDKNGNVNNIILPFPNLKNNPSVIYRGGYYGLTVGRYANRISNSEFSVNGVKYSFKSNDKSNLLHSGEKGLSFRLFNISLDKSGIVSRIRVKESEDGFPGDLDLVIKFSLVVSDEKYCIFNIKYSLVCTKDCPINLTNHSYFNLTGNPDNDISSHLMQINSSSVVINDNLLLPNKILEVKHTHYDFTNEREIGKNPNYDNSFFIDRGYNLSKGYIRCCTIREQKSGRIMSVYSDMPSFQLYTSSGAEGIGLYRNYSGFCIETGYIPNSINSKLAEKLNGNTIVKSNELYETTTSFVFYI